MLYGLVFKGYFMGEIKIEEHHLFSSLDDLYDYAVWLLEYMGNKHEYDHYDIQVKFPGVDYVPPAA